MLALVIFSVLSLAVGSLIQRAYKEMKTVQMAQLRDQILLQTRTSALRLENIRYSLGKAANQKLKSCLCGTGCESWQNYAVELWSGPAASEQKISPTYFDSSGTPCDSNQPNCIFQVTSVFFAQCRPFLPHKTPTPPVSCPATPAEFIKLEITVEVPSDKRVNGMVTGSQKTAVYLQEEDVAALPLGLCL